MKCLRSLFKVSLVLSFLVLLSCEDYTFKNGRIPAEYIVQAKLLTGTYAGRFLQRDGTLTLELKADLAVLKFKSAEGNDLVGKNCHSQIGLLKRARISRHGEIERLYFAFDPGNCDIPGREVGLEFSNKYQKIILYLADYDFFDQECEWNGHGRNPPTSPVYECHTVIRHHDFKGAFFRKP